MQIPPSLKLPSPSRTDLSRDYAGQDGGQVRSKVQPQISQINTDSFTAENAKVAEKI